MSFVPCRPLIAAALAACVLPTLSAQENRPDARRSPQGGAVPLQVRTSTAPATAAAETESVRSSNGIAAVVNGRPILQSEVQELNRFQTMQLRSSVGERKELDRQLADLNRKTLDTLIERELILKEFEPHEASFGDKIKALTDEYIKNEYVNKIFKGDRVKFLKEMKDSGMSYRKFYEQQRRGVIVSAMTNQNIKKTGFVTSDEKSAYLQAHIEDFRDGDQIKLWSITIPKIGDGPGAGPAAQMVLAKEIRTKLIGGADFGSLAKTYSADSRSGSGGDWGFITKKDLTRRMADMVFALPDKKISDVVEFDDSYYIFYIEARKPGQMKPQEEIEARLEKLVLMEKSIKAREEWINRLKRKATIRYGQP